MRKQRLQISICPSGLDGLLKHANLFPPSQEIGYPVKRVEQLMDLMFGGSKRDTEPEREAAKEKLYALERSAAVSTFNKIIEQLPENPYHPESLGREHMRAFFLANGLGNELAALLYIGDMEDLRRDLRQIANRFSLKRAGDDSMLVIDRLITRSQMSIQIVFDGNIARVKPSGLAAAINGVDCDRIRRCQYCDRLFWAPRTDSNTCSDTCRNVLNVRNARKRAAHTTEDQLSRRQANREYKKTLTKRNQSNGSL